MEELGHASIPAVVQYLKSAQSLNVDTDQALQQAGIDPALLEDNCKRITGEALQNLLATIIPASSDPLFGLHTSKFIQPNSYSVLGYIAMNSSTLRDAMNRIGIYEKLVGDMGITRTHKKGELTIIQWCCKYTHPLVRRHIIENVLSSWVTYTRWISGSDEPPVEVWIEHSAPEPASLIKEYDVLFGCPILFNKQVSAVIVNDEILDHKLKQADEALLSTLEKHATELLADMDQELSFSHKVKRILRMLLASGIPRKESVADALKINARTLQRRLQEEGNSYQNILDELRKEIAVQQLTDTDQAIPDIAQLLGFTETRSFHRSFKAWTGLTPGQYRQQASDD